MRLLAVSVDLDEIDCYAAIHGLRAPAGESLHAVYDRAVPRYERWFDALGVRGTFFTIGRDLARSEAASAIARLHRDGHEIGNHSFDHRYDFSRRSGEQQREDVARGRDAIAGVTGEPPIGFRAPGYLVNDRVFEQLNALGVGYDSSVFACPGYYLAKSAALSLIALRGRKSHSIFGDPRVLTAPADPYHIGNPYYVRGNGLLELPIAVTSNATGRLPFIGTSVALAGDGGAAWLARQMIGRPLVNLELHGIDLCDADEDGLRWLAPHQHDIRKPLVERQRALEVAISTLRDAGYVAVTLAEAAKLIG